jgi:hypothetical protein
MPPGVHGELGHLRRKAVHPSLHIWNDTHHLKLQSRAQLRDLNLVHPKAERRRRPVPIPPRQRRLSIHAAVDDLQLVVQPPPLMRIPGDPETGTNLMACRNESGLRIDEHTSTLRPDRATCRRCPSVWCGAEHNVAGQTRALPRAGQVAQPGLRVSPDSWR